MTLALNFKTPAAVATVQRNVKRKSGVAGAVATINRHVDQRVGELADNISRGAVIKSRIVLVNQAIAGLIDLLYEVDESGHPVNIDPITGRILVPVPWGEAGWRKWKLRRSEGRHLRKVLDRRMRTEERVAMFVYDGESNAWHLARRYGHKEAAFAYLQNNPITVAEWRQVRQ